MNTELVITMFKVFNGDMDRFKELFDILSKDKFNGILFHYHRNHSTYLDMHVGGVGILTLHYDLTDMRCIFSFKKDNDHLSPEVNKDIYTKMDMDTIIDNIIPFMVSKGGDRRRIPLLLNIFPEIVKFALEFTYDPEY